VEHSELERLAAIGQARRVADPVQVARPTAFVRQAVRIHGGLVEARSHDAVCELDSAGMRITNTQTRWVIAWPDVRSVVADRGRVRIISPSGAIVLSIALDGVAEPGLAAPFARVLEAGRSGGPNGMDRAGALHELTLAIDRVVEGFGDADDPVIPVAIGGFAVMAGVILLAAVPFGAQAAARITPVPGTFAILPHLAAFDPRVLVAAFAGGSALSAVVARAGLGTTAVAWARGTVRGWHRNATGLDTVLRRVVAQVVLFPRILATVAFAAILLALPSVFARTVVDAGGLHTASGLPFLSSDSPWSDVTDVVPVAVGFGERLEGFATTLVLADGSRVSTRGRDLLGGPERAFYDFSRAHAR